MSDTSAEKKLNAALFDISKWLGTTTIAAFAVGAALAQALSLDPPAGACELGRWLCSGWSIVAFAACLSILSCLLFLILNAYAEYAEQSMETRSRSVPGSLSHLPIAKALIRPHPSFATVRKLRNAAKISFWLQVGMDSCAIFLLTVVVASGNPKGMGIRHFFDSEQLAKLSDMKVKFDTEKLTPLAIEPMPLTVDGRIRLDRASARLLRSSKIGLVECQRGPDVPWRAFEATIRELKGSIREVSAHVRANTKEVQENKKMVKFNNPSYHTPSRAKN